MKLILMILALFFSRQTFAGSALPTPKNVDIARYVGKWYAVSSLPQFFTRSCIGQTAEYQLLSSNSVSVLNTCYKKNGKTSYIEGQAIVKDPTTNARLEVIFNNFFTRLFHIKGEYVIIKLSEDYDTVLVGTTDRRSLWIMSRTPNISPKLLAEYISEAKSLGFSIEKLITSKF